MLDHTYVLTQDLLPFCDSLTAVVISSRLHAYVYVYGMYVCVYGECV